MRLKRFEAALLAAALFPWAAVGRAAVVDPTKLEAMGFSMPAELAESTRALGKKISSRISGHVSGSGTVSGSGFVHCNGSVLNGSIPLSGTIQVSDGKVDGSIHVSGTVSVSGTCFNGSGHGSGSAWVSGTGTVRDRKGNTASAYVNGSTFVSVSSHGGYVSAFVTVSGNY